MEYGAKIAQLQAQLDALAGREGSGGLLVAFSGGVDSAVLLASAKLALGRRAIGVIADSASLPRSELTHARDVARHLGARLVEVRTDELQEPAYRANSGRRCYHCKNALFEAMEEVARAEGITNLAFGEIVEDRLDHRPGAQAAAERHILSPLCDAGLGKEDVRRRARELGLPNWEKAASACLASRIPTGTPVSEALLGQVERAEAALKELGLRDLRVRHFGSQARLEVGEADWDLAQTLQARVQASLADCGFEAVEWARYVPAHLRNRTV